MITQETIVLNLLRKRGKEGVHTFELRGGAAGAMVGNPSQRIANLEEDGHVFDRQRERFHGTAQGTRYFLVRDADVRFESDDDGQLRIEAA